MKTRQFAIRPGFMMAALPFILLFLASAEEVGTTQVVERKPILRAELEQSFPLRVGQSAQVESLRITFSRVVEDSRCPSDVLCVWAGDAALEFLVSGPETERTAITLHTTLTPREAMVDEYQVRLIEVAPYPKTTSPIAMRAYRATLIVSKDSGSEPIEPTDQ